MGLFNRLFSRLSERVIKNTPDNRILVEAAMRRGIEPIRKLLSYENVLRRAQNLKMWKEAVSAATDPENPSKLQLWDFYDNLLLDNHLRSCIDTRISYVQRSPFKLVDDKGNESKDHTWLLQRPWMEDLIYLVIMSRFQGTTLIELFETNEKGELARVDEIPLPYFNAKLGIITKEQDDNTGWSYREGAFKDYYLQIGKETDLGELEKLGPIVLAKKLALGAYQDYVEKFGVPPLFITTDREDETRLNQLFEAAMNFKSNSFMVGRGQEKFEVGQINGAGTAPFIELMNFANDELSKGVLGGTGLNSEKAFVGSANIQMELATNRFKSDSLFFKYIFNEEVKPRLLKLSPVYKPLEKLYFEWDESESLDMNGYIDAVTKLGSQYEIDPEQIEERTGIKIIGLKQSTFNNTELQPQGGEAGGK